MLTNRQTDTQTDTTENNTTLASQLVTTFHHQNMQSVSDVANSDVDDSVSERVIIYWRQVSTLG